MKPAIILEMRLTLVRETKQNMVEMPAGTIWHTANDNRRDNSNYHQTTIANANMVMFVVRRTHGSNS